MTLLQVYLAMPEDAKKCVEDSAREGIKFADAITATLQILQITDRPTFDKIKASVKETNASEAA